MSKSNWLRNVGRLFQNNSRRRQRRQLVTGPVAVGRVMEGLESRQLLSATTSLSGGVLKIDGTQGADHVQVYTNTDVASVSGDQEIQKSDFTSHQHSQVTVIVNGAVKSFPAASVNKIKFIGRGGDDYFAAEFTEHEDTVVNGERHQAERRYSTRKPIVAYGGAGSDKLIGSRKDDVLYGADTQTLNSTDDEHLEGRDGNDRLYTNNGNDYVHGGDLSDFIATRGGIDFIHGGWGSDEIYAGSGDDRVIGSWGRDVIYGQDGDDYIDAGVEPEKRNDGTFITYGNADADTVYGESGNDTILGGWASDKLYGGPGDDVIVGGRYGDRLEGGSGNDTIFGDEQDPNSAVAGGPDNIFGGDGDDIMYGGKDQDIFSAGRGNDVVYGNKGNDKAELGDGDDIFWGGVGNDIANGWSGNDELHGGDGADILRGYRYNHNGNYAHIQDDDIIYGDNGNDILGGQTGNDKIYGGYGFDELWGSHGNDILHGGHHGDEIYGGGGHDLLYGEHGWDTLGGGDGNDELYGGDGNDDLNGWNGDDLLFGGAGTDTYDGHYGNDIKYDGDASTAFIAELSSDGKTVTLDADGSGYQLYSQSGWTKTTTAFVASSAVEMRDLDGTTIDTKIADSGFQLPTVATSKNSVRRLHIPSESTAGLEVPDVVASTLSNLYGLSFDRTTSSVSFKTGAELQLFAGMSTPVDPEETYLLVTNKQASTVSFGGVTAQTSSSPSGTSFSLIVQPGSDFLFAKLETSAASVAFGISATDELVFNGANSKYRTDDQGEALESVRGNLYLELSDIDVTGKGGIDIIVGGWGLIDFDGENQASLSSSKVMDIISAATGSPASLVSVVGDVFGSMPTDVGRIAIGGSVAVGVSAGNAISASYTAGEGSVIVDLNEEEVFARAEFHAAPSLLADLPVADLLLGSDSAVVDAKLDYGDLGQSAFFVQSGSFEAEVDFDTGVSVKGSREYFGQSFGFEGSIGWNGDVHLTGTVAQSKSVSFLGARVNIGQTWTATISGNFNQSLVFGVDAGWWLEGTHEVDLWLTSLKFGVAGTVDISAEVELDLDDFGIDRLEADVTASATVYYGVGSTSISAGLGIAIDDEGVRIDLGSFGSVSF